MKKFTLSLFAAFIAWLSSTASAEANNISAETLTIANSAHFGGVASFGYADGAVSGTGFTMDVFSGVTTVEREDVTPGHWTYSTTWEDEWGWLDGQTQIVWVEEYGEIIEWVWVEEYGDVQVEIWVSEEYDGDGNLIGGGYYNYETFSGVIGGHYEEVPGWGVVGGHYEETTSESVYAIVGSHEVVSQIWVDEERNSYTETVIGVPVIRFTAQTDDSVWRWKNLGKNLMELSPAGISLPKPNDHTGYHHAILTSTTFEQSYTYPDNAGNGSDYRSYGVKMKKDGIEGWSEVGEGAYVSSAQAFYVKPSEIIIKDMQPDPETNSIANRTTRISVSSSQFGGSVAVHGDLHVGGVLRVPESGDISMGQFRQGPPP